MFELETSGSWSRTQAWLDRLLNSDIYRKLDRFGEIGLEALAANTPIDTGTTAASWAYIITKTGTGYRITWYNTNDVEGSNIAILLQYGHGTGTGGYVSGTDYVNPAMAPIFEEVVTMIRKEVQA